MNTRLVGGAEGKAIFATEKPWRRTRPISVGLSSAAQQEFRIEDGYSSQATYDLVFVYDSVESAKAALPEIVGVLTSRKSSRYDVSDVNPPAFLGEDAVAATGSMEPGDTEVAICVMAWRQANVITAIEVLGLLKGPLKTCLLMSKRAHKATAEKVPA